MDEDASFESGLVALTTGAPHPPERRDEPRILSVLRVGKLVGPAGEELCRIRNIAAGGIMAEVAVERQVGDRVTVEITSDRPIGGEIIWTRGLTVGIRFDACIDVVEVLSNRRGEDGYFARPPRLDIQCTARVRLGARYYNVQVRNVSQGGIGVAIKDPCWPVGMAAVITIPDLGTMDGVLRWCEDGVAGMSFNSPISFETLSHWLGVRKAAAQQAS